MDQTSRLAPVKKRRSPSNSHPAMVMGGADATTSIGSLVSPADLAEVRSRQVLAALMAFSGGNFSTRLPADWAGTDGRIAEAFNLTIGHAELVTREAARLSMTVGKEGDCRNGCSFLARSAAGPIRSTP